MINDLSDITARRAQILAKMITHSCYSESLSGNKTDNKATVANIDKWLADITNNMEQKYEALSEKIVTLEAKVVTLEKEAELDKVNIKYLQDQLLKQTKENDNISWASLTSKNNKKSDQLNIIEAVGIKLQKEKETIQNNIIISGFKEDETSDDTKVDSVLAILNLDRDKVKRQRRLRRTNKEGENISNTILVEFKDIVHKQTAIAHAKDLRKENSFKNVYVNEDKTAAERLFDYENRKKRNELNNKLQYVSEGAQEGRQRYGIKCDGKFKGCKFYWAINKKGELSEIYYDKPREVEESTDPGVPTIGCESNEASRSVEEAEQNK